MKKAIWLLAFLLLARASAWEQVESEQVRVVYPDPALTAYATDVARVAEAALNVLEPLFGPREGKVVLRLNNKVDWFNAYATTLPRRSIELLAPAPAGDLIDLRSPSISYLLLIHELTHTQQLTYKEKPDGGKPARMGLVTELSAPMPPAWFVEGIATYMESRFTPGGRLDWASTQGLLNALFMKDQAFPDLADMSLYTYRSWPGWRTRYLLGVRFVNYLINKHGWESILRLLQQYNNGLLLPPSFADAWQQANGSSLLKEWRGWLNEERRRATAYAAVAVTGNQLMKGGYDPVISPDGQLLAYQGKRGIWVMDRDGSNARLLARVRTQKLWWADNQTLVYSRYIREGDNVASDIFSLNVRSGQETRLSRGLHARLAAPGPNGCFYFVRERQGEAASLRRLCGKEETALWQAVGGEHLVGLAVSPGGRIALSIWRGGVVDLALLENGHPRYLLAGRLQVSPPAPTPDPCTGGGQTLGSCYQRNRHQHVSLAWDGDYTLLFRADESGVWDLYKVSLPEARVTRLSASLSGVFGASSYSGIIYAAEIVSSGYAIVALPALGEPVKPATRSSANYMAFCNSEPPAPAERVPAGRPSGKRLGCGENAQISWKLPKIDVKHFTYSPWPSLAPYGWLAYPAFYTPQAALEFSLFGLDETGVYSYRVSGGYSFKTTGPLSGAYAYVATGINAGVDLVGKTAPLGFTLRAGAWPSGRFSIESGFLLGVASKGYWDRWSWQASLEAGPVWDDGWRIERQANARLGLEVRDAWGYLAEGGYAGISNGLSAAGDVLHGYSGAAWTTKPFGFNLAIEAKVDGSLSVSSAVGVATLSEVLAQMRLRHSIKTEWRTSDGWLALERLTVAPGGRVWYDGGFGYGAELGFYADSVLFYSLPLSVGFRAGYADGWWWRLELGPW